MSVRKYYLGLLPVALVAAMCCSLPKPATEAPYFGDAETIGVEGESSERQEYEWLMLRDPATGKIPAHIRERELAFAATLPQASFSSALAKTTAAPWVNRGPWNVGGRTRALAMDVNNENILIAGSCSGGMWRSTDKGLTWTPTSTNTQPKSVTCVAQDTRPGHTNTWYYGSGEAYGASAGSTGAYYLGTGIYKSTDNGATWSVLPSTTSAAHTAFDMWSDLVWNVATDPSNTTEDEVYAAAYGGIFRSTNGGSTWTVAKGIAASGSYFTDVVVTATGVVYATLSSDGPHKGLYRSADGVTFTNITPAGFPTTYNRVKIGVCPDDENQVYFLGNTPGGGMPDTNYVGDIEWNSLWKYKYVSGDGSGAGGVWRNLSDNLPSTGGPFAKYNCQGSYDIVVKVKPGDSNTVFIGGTNLYRSTTGFKDSDHTRFIGGYAENAGLPRVAMYPEHHPDQHEIIFLPGNPNVMYSANDGGVFMTNNNMAATVSWNSLNYGYLTTMFYTCAIDHAETNNIITAGAQDNGSWYTNSASATAPWVTPRGGDGSYCAIADHGKAYYFSIQNGKMMRAKLNSSGMIDSYARIDPLGAKNYLFINPYVLDPNNNNIMYLAGGRYLWRNNDLSGIPYASNWDSINTNWVRWADSVPIANAKITAIAVSTKPANRVYYGTSSRKVYRVDNANTGTPTPVEITGNTAAANFPAGYVSSIAVDPENADRVMVVFSNYGVYSIFFSTNGGTTWTRAAGNLEETPFGGGEGPSIRWARIMHVAGGTVYLVGTSVGLFGTTEIKGTETVWKQLGANTIGNSVVHMIDSRETDGLVVVATHSHGIYSGRITSVADVSGITDQAGVQAGFTNFPNPFSNETTIQVDLPQSGYMSLKVYDVAGRLVRTIAEGRFDAGRHQYQFGSAGTVPGTYLCVLQAGNEKSTRQLVVR